MTGIKLLEQTIGVHIKILSNEYQELPGYGDQINTHQQIVFQIKEEGPMIMRLGFYSASH